MEAEKRDANGMTQEEKDLGNALVRAVLKPLTAGMLTIMDCSEESRNMIMDTVMGVVVDHCMMAAGKRAVVNASEPSSVVEGVSHLKTNVRVMTVLHANLPEGLPEALGKELSEVIVKYNELSEDRVLFETEATVH